MSYFFTGDLITSNASTLLTESKGIAYRPVDNGHETILRGPKTGNIGGVTVLHLPDDTGTSGQVLQTDGDGVLSFATVGGSPAGSDTQLQYNNGGSFGAITGFTYNDGTDNLLVNTALSSIVATGNSSNALAIVSDGGTLSTLKILNDHGTDNAAIELTASSGGITAKVADEKELTLGNANGDAYFKVAPSATAGNEDVRIVNTNGTDNAAIELTASSGGITAKVADEKELTLGNASGDAYFKVAPSATAGNEDVRIVNTSGTDNAAIELTASSGGITAKVADEKELTFGNADGDAYFKVAPSVTAGNEDVRIVNTNGTDNAAIELTASAGGITLAPGTAITTSKGFITSPYTFGISDTAALSTHQLITTTNNAVYLNLSDSDGTDTATLEVSGSNTAGQNMHLFFDNAGSNNLRLDFGNNLLTSGSGLAQYLTFSNTGQSASLMYVGSKWRIINTGAVVS